MINNLIITGSIHGVCVCANVCWQSICLYLIECGRQAQCIKLYQCLYVTCRRSSSFVTLQQGKCTSVLKTSIENCQTHSNLGYPRKIKRRDRHLLQQLHLPLLWRLHSMCLSQCHQNSPSMSRKVNRCLVHSLKRGILLWQIVAARITLDHFMCQVYTCSMMSKFFNHE